MNSFRLIAAAFVFALAGCSPGLTPAPAPQATPSATASIIPEATHTPIYSPSPTPVAITPVSTPTATVSISDAPTSAPSTSPQMLALSAYNFSRGAGVNLHVNYGDGQWTNTKYMMQMVESMMFGAVRESLTVLPGTNNAWSDVSNQFYQNGIDQDFLTDSSVKTPDDVNNYLKLIEPHSAKYIEGPNELNVCCGDSNWAEDDRGVMMNALWPDKIAEGTNTFEVIGPSLTVYESTPLGDLTNYEDYTNIHDYTSTRIPETTGWGGGFFGYAYGDIRATIAAATQLSKNPTVSTEFGYETDPSLQSTTNLSEYTQAAYLERQFIYHALLGVNVQFMYDLFDEGDSTDGFWGVVHADGSQKPAASGIQGMLTLLHDTKPAPQPCYAPVAIGQRTNPSADVRTAVFCKSTGEYDIVVWQAAQIQDPITLVDDQIPETTIPITLYGNPQSVVEWTQSIDYQWSFQTNPDLTQLAPNERLMIIVVNGPTPTNIPALPTPSQT